MARSDQAPQPGESLEFLSRHRGLFTDEDIDRLGRATVAIAGVGGVGGRLAEVLARSGVGTLRLADPDIFTASNLNRQGGSTLHNLGFRKVDVLADLCRSVSPIVSISTEPEGITDDNLDQFVRGADVVVDGTDYTIPSLGLRLQRRAAEEGVPVAIGVEVGFAAWHTVLVGTGAFERLMGLERSVTAARLDSGEVEIPLWRWIGALPRHVPMATVEAIAAGEIEAPAIAPAVELSSALLATSVLRLILGKPPVIRAPKIHLVDLVSGTSSKFRPTYLRFVASALLRRK